MKRILGSLDGCHRILSNICVLDCSCRNQYIQLLPRVQVVRQVQYDHSPIQKCMRNIKSDCAMTMIVQAWHAGGASADFCVAVCAELHNTNTQLYILIKLQCNIRVGKHLFLLVGRRVTSGFHRWLHLFCRQRRKTISINDKGELECRASIASDVFDSVHGHCDFIAAACI